MAAETDIWDALSAHLRALTLSPAHPIAWPNVDYTPPNGHKFLRINEFPAIANPITLNNGAIEYRGFIQIDVFGPLKVGLNTQKAIAAAVATHFKAGTVLFSGSTKLRISSAVVGANLISDPRMMIPVTVNWSALAAN